MKSIYAVSSSCYTRPHSLAAVIARDVAKPPRTFVAKERSCASCAGLVASGPAFSL
jgi:hypothetical protein